MFAQMEKIYYIILSLFNLELASLGSSICLNFRYESLRGQAFSFPRPLVPPVFILDKV